MVKIKSKFVCQECGYESAKWLGRCPGCGNWNTLIEEREFTSKGGSITRSHQGKKNKGIPITEVKKQDQPRFDTGIPEMNRVLGGGVVQGSLVLVGGDPGIGKSTLILQVSSHLGGGGLPVLYISGEESLEQIRMRGERLGALSEHLYVVSETDLTAVEPLMDEISPKLVIIDSIQTMFHPEITSAPGSVAQVRECTSHLMRLAKGRHIPILIIGHVTKSGAIAGPRMLEHMVDAVLYFEGERHHTFRILRAVKNRFGSTNEIGVFEMKESGLTEVVNPSELFLSGRPTGVSGTSVAASLEGTRPILVELQALLSSTNFPTPKRMATGIDPHRVNMIMAVLEKRMGMNLQYQDAYLNVVGGVRLNEPAVDLAVAVSLASSFRDRPTGTHDIMIGEIGLTGEVRSVSRIEQRVMEAYQMGFKRAILPEKNRIRFTPPENMALIGVNTLGEALEVALGG